MLCPKCLEDESVVRDRTWFPSSGIDPLLRKYDCSRCKKSFYAPSGRVGLKKKQKKSQQVLL